MCNQMTILVLRYLCTLFLLICLNFVAHDLDFVSRTAIQACQAQALHERFQIPVPGTQPSCAPLPVDTCGDNGVCVDGSCMCLEGFTGDKCNECSGRRRVVDTSGIISDGPEHYRERRKCTWLLESSNNSTINLKLSHFATECNWDYVYVYDGNSLFAPLIGSFSGIIRPQDAKNTTLVREMQSSGPAVYLHFHSDSAYIITGFDIAYSMAGGCGYNCSGRGRCEGGVCSCYQGYGGAYCQLETCPNNCTQHGTCDQDRCNCNAGRRGEDCSVSESEAVWSWGRASHLPPGRASHATVAVGGKLWVVGGQVFSPRQHFVYSYDLTTQVWSAVNTSGTPSPRYGHSLVHHGGQLLMYGGMVNNRATNELWRLDLTDLTWSLVVPSNNSATQLAVTSHTAHVVGGQFMLVLFGHSPLYGYLGAVQLYDIDLNEWSVVKTQGAKVSGTFGHVSALDSAGENVYVHGGLMATGKGTFMLSDQLLKYHWSTGNWRVLVRSGIPVVLHAGAVVGEMLLVVGGNLHNDSTSSTGRPCHTSQTLAYDTVCDAWYTLEESSVMSTRYGHSLTAHNGNTYVVGGFDGQMLGDVHKFTPGSCTPHKDQESCESSQQGSRCYWCSGRCLTSSEATAHLSKGATCSSDRETLCRHYNTSATREDDCKPQQTCAACLHNTNDCVWCGESCTTLDKCSASRGRVQDVAKCPANETGCVLLRSCFFCNSNPACRWDNTSHVCRDSGLNASVIASLPSVADFTKPGVVPGEPRTCEAECTSLETCEDCATRGCIWCGQPELCVDENAYVSSFPYGQCLEWTNQKRFCPAVGCSGLKKCSDCLSNPACGWCNDDSDTGLGTCMEGSPDTPRNSSSCPAPRWHFIDCPLCQCNGHSECKANTSICEDCQHNTAGDECHRCKDGYFGNSNNGGNCSKCFCNRHGDLCHHTTGVCQCTTRGIIGDNCELCDEVNRYYGNPKTGTCFYNLNTDYQFTFNLSKDQDKHLTQINLMNYPPASDKDVEFTLKLSEEAFVNVTIISDAGPDEQLVGNYRGRNIKETFKHDDHNLGADNTTFRVYVYGFKIPFMLQVSFSQSPHLDLVEFFLTFFGYCRVLLLLLLSVPPAL